MLTKLIKAIVVVLGGATLAAFVLIFIGGLLENHQFAEFP